MATGNLCFETVFRNGKFCDYTNTISIENRNEKHKSIIDFFHIILNTKSFVADFLGCTLIWRLKPGHRPENTVFTVIVRT